MTQNEINLILKNLSEDANRQDQNQNNEIVNTAQTVESMLNPDKNITDEFFDGLDA